MLERCQSVSERYDRMKGYEDMLTDRSDECTEDA